MDDSVTVTSASSLTFTTSNWNTVQAVTIAALDDDLEEPAVHSSNVAVRVSSSDSRYDSTGVCAVASAATSSCSRFVANAGATAAVDITDNDAISIVVAPTTLAATEGATDTYTVVLGSQPWGTVNLALTADSQVSVDSSSIAFTTANWATPQTITVTAVDDQAVEAALHSGTITHAVTSTDTGYNGRATDAVDMAITENDTAEIVVSSTTVTVGENGGVATYTVELSSAPTDDVTVAVAMSSTGSITLSPSSFLFTASTWNVPVTVIVTGVDNEVDAAADATVTLTHSTTTSDQYYSASADVDVVTTVTDDDVAQLELRLAVTPMQFSEGSLDKYRVALGSRPTETVTVTITASSSDISVSPSTLTFAADSTWNVAQQVTVTASENNVVVASPGKVEYTLTHAISSSDAQYGSVADNDLSLWVVDNDKAGLAISAQSIGLVEGARLKYQISLYSQPSASVTVTLTGQDSSQLAFTPSSASLTFTTATWDQFQIITVRAVDDDVDEAAVETYSLTHTVTSSDSNYEGLTYPLSVSVTDDDGAGVAVSTGSLTVNEGTTGNYTLVLVSDPVNDVTITVAPTASALFIINNCCDFVFTTANWNVPQAVLVNALPNSVDSGVSNTFSVSATAASSTTQYQGIAIPEVSVVIVDDDVAGLTMTMSSTDALSGGDTVTLSVVLDSKPSASVEVKLTSSSTRASLAATSLTFTSSNFNTAQTVVITNTDGTTISRPALVAYITGTALSTDASYNYLQARAEASLAVVVNQPPVAEAGLNRVSWAGAAVTVDGSASSDPENLALTYKWSQVSGVAATIAASTAASTEVSGLAVGAPRELRLTVTDSSGQKAVDQVTVWTPGIAAAAATTSATLSGACVRGTVCNLSWRLGGFPTGSTVSLKLRTPAGALADTLALKLTTSSALATTALAWEVPLSLTAGTGYRLILSVEGNFANVPAGTVTTATSENTIDIVSPYNWHTGSYGACDESCGNGTQTRDVTCKAADGTVVADSQCEAGSKPTATRTCNLRSCDYRWIEGTYGACDKVCGLGTQTRTLECKRFDDTVVPNAKCAAATGQDLQATRGCSLRACSVSYVAAPWTACTATCGYGIETRAVVCQDELGVQVPFGRCSNLAVVAGQRQCFLKPCGTTAGWRASEWSACSSTCGGGTSTRTVACVDQSNAVVADSECVAADKPEASRECNTHTCETYSWSYTNWGECSKQCGTGQRSRHRVCLSSANRIVSSVRCVALNSAALTEACNTNACPSFYWEPQAWGTCSESCGPSGVKTRTLVCKKGDGTNAASDSDCAGAAAVATTANCNRFPCQIFSWGVSEWGTCSADCDGTRSRGVSCTGGLVDVTAPDSSCDATLKPATSETCDAPTASCDFCQDNDCSGRGTCTNGACVCDSGFSGDLCQSSDAQCPNGHYFPNAPNAADRCCVGVVMGDGTCCSGANAKVDANGACCAAGNLDACGVCGGTGVAVDVTGKCCSGQLDAGGVCCTGNVDACGVCDGQNSCKQELKLIMDALGSTDTADLSDETSATRLELDFKLRAYIAAALNIPESSILIDGFAEDARRRLSTAGGARWRSLFSRAVQAVTGRRLGTTLEATVVIGGSYDSTTTNLVDPAAASNSLVGSSSGITVNSLAASTAVGVCGNDICEVGERCDARDPTKPCCSQDCPFAVVDCPASNGAVCNNAGVCVTSLADPSRGSCRCHSGMGYAGDACDGCASGFVMMGSGSSAKCVPVAPASCFDGVQNGDESGADCGGPCDACPVVTPPVPVDPGSDSTTIIIVAVVSAVVAAGVAFVLFKVCCGKDKNAGKTIPEGYKGPRKTSSPSVVPEMTPTPLAAIDAETRMLQQQTAMLQQQTVALQQQAAAYSQGPAAPVPMHNNMFQAPLATAPALGANPGLVTVPSKRVMLPPMASSVPKPEPVADNPIDRVTPRLGDVTPREDLNPVPAAPVAPTSAPPAAAADLGMTMNAADIAAAAAQARAMGDASAAAATDVASSKVAEAATDADAHVANLVSQADAAFSDEEAEVAGKVAADANAAANADANVVVSVDAAGSGAGVGAEANVSVDAEEKAGANSDSKE